MQNGKQQDAEEFLRLYLDALDEELLARLASISGHKSATAAPGDEERQESQSANTDVGKRVVVVRQLFHSLFVELGIADGCISSTSRP